MNAWQPYQPTRDQPWNARRAAHLHRRALFGGTWDEVERDLAGSPSDAIDRVFAAEVRSDGVPDDFESLSELIAGAAADQPNPQRLKAAIIYRVLFSPDPLTERLALMWHNHFATSNAKVDSLPLMKHQYDTFRQHAKAPFGDLLRDMIQDPALLIWLDAPVNERHHPNENLGRELMELFTLGVGNYSETDVKETARALTGISVKNGAFAFDAERHDDAEKTILGKTQRFDGESVCQLLLEHRATAERLAGRLIAEFFGDGVVDADSEQALADQLIKHDLDIGKAAETILRSRLFFSDANINSRISDPMSFLITPIRALKLFRTPPNTLVLAEWLGRMGMDLLYPPNVAGWPGSRAWLATRTVISRANYAAAVADGGLHRRATRPDFDALASGHAGGGETAIRKTMRTLLIGSETEPDKLASGNPRGEDDSKYLIRLLTSPHAHLH